MLRNFFSTHRIVITPLSPIHIGTGEDYEPTNYVIDANRHLLYGFNPGQAVLTPEELRQLHSAVGTGTLQAVNRFYQEHIESFRPWADTVVPISDAGLRYHRKMLAPQGREKMTQFVIARAAYDRRHGIAAPYVPGSSVKGMIATALMNRLNDRRPSTKEEAGNPAGVRKKLLEGDLERSPMRFVKVGDCHGGEVPPLTAICSSRRFFKDDATGDGIKACFETVVPGQYRCFGGELTLADGMNISSRKNPRVPHCYADGENLLKDLHAYSLENWETELEFCRNDAAPWAQSVRRLLDALAPQIRAGRIALIRLGKNAGAESKTLHGRHVPQISIRHKTGDKEVREHSSTAWFTDESPRKSGEKDVINGLPYGWALIELDPKGENVALKAWCGHELRRSGLNDATISVINEWKAIRAARRAAEEKRRALLEANLQREEARRLAAEEEQRRIDALAALSPAVRAAEELCDALEKAPVSVRPGTDLFSRTKQLLADAQNWTCSDDQKKLAGRIAPLLKAKQMYQGKAEKEFKAALRRLRGEA